MTVAPNQGPDRYNAWKDCEARIIALQEISKRISASLIEASKTIKQIKDILDDCDDSDEIIEQIENIIEEYYE